MGAKVIVCTTCAAALEVDSSLAGKLVRCYNCDNVVGVPFSRLSPGDLFGGCVVERPIGNGTSGELWLAVNIKGAPVALRVFPPALNNNNAYIGRLSRNLNKIGQSQLPGIVVPVGFGVESQQHYLFTPFIEGKTLKALLDETKAVPERKALRLIRRLAVILGHAWNETKISHTDLSPANIMITSKEVKIMDFGIPRNMCGALVADGGVVILGSPAHMSPEQANMEDDLDCRSDIYSLGCILYHMVTGRPPFLAPDAQIVMGMHLHDRFPPPLDLSPSLSDACSVLIYRLLAKDRDNRPQSWGDALAEIETAMEGKKPKINLEASNVKINQSQALMEFTDTMAAIPVASRSLRRLSIPPFPLPNQDEGLGKSDGLKRKKRKTSRSLAKLSESRVGGNRGGSQAGGHRRGSMTGPHQTRLPENKTIQRSTIWIIILASILVIVLLALVFAMNEIGKTRRGGAQPRRGALLIEAPGAAGRT